MMAKWLGLANEDPAISDVLQFALSEFLGHLTCRYMDKL